MEDKELKLTIQDFEGKNYIYEKSKIDFAEKGEIPKRLYKYYALTENSVNSISDACNPYLYFSHPHQFNDLVDSSVLLWDMTDFPYEDFLAFYNYLSNNEKQIYRALFFEDKANHFTKLKSIVKNKFKSGFIYEEHYWIYYLFTHSNFTGLMNMLFRYQSENWGVLCLTESYKNNLMWAHYTGETGFCIEFESLKLTESLKDNKFKVFPVNYQFTLQRILVKDYFCKTTNGNGTTYDFGIPFLYLFSTKDKSWCYENEWRVVLQNKGMGYEANKLDFNCTGNVNHQKRSICYSKQAIKKIILGPHFFNNKSFEKEAITGSNYKYNFKGGSSDLYKQLLFSFLNNYNHCLFQIEHFIDGNILRREITHKIVIESMNDKSVVVNAELLPEFA